METLGRAVRIDSHGRSVEGVAMALDDDGSLVIRESTGKVTRWCSGDVERLCLKPAQR